MKRSYVVPAKLSRGKRKLLKFTFTVMPQETKPPENVKLFNHGGTIEDLEKRLKEKSEEWAKHWGSSFASAAGFLRAHKYPTVDRLPYNCLCCTCEEITSKPAWGELHP